MPITNALYGVLFEGEYPLLSVEKLMLREKEEMDATYE